MNFSVQQGWLYVFFLTFAGLFILQCNLGFQLRFHCGFRKHVPLLPCAMAALNALCLWKWRYVFSENVTGSLIAAVYWDADVEVSSVVSFCGLSYDDDSISYKEPVVA
jgi:hypothetical protein